MELSRLSMTYFFWTLWAYSLELMGHDRGYSSGSPGRGSAPGADQLSALYTPMLYRTHLVELFPTTLVNGHTCVFFSRVQLFTLSVIRRWVCIKWALNFHVPKSTSFVSLTSLYAHSHVRSVGNARCFTHSYQYYALLKMCIRVPYPLEIPWL